MLTKSLPLNFSDGMRDEWKPKWAAGRATMAILVGKHHAEVMMMQKDVFFIIVFSFGIGRNENEAVSIFKHRK